MLDDTLPTSPPTDAKKPSRLDIIVESMREMSRQTDPQAMVRAYGRRMGALMPRDGLVAVSRRGLAAPRYRVTRSSVWKRDVNPWAERDSLPLFDRGLLGELLYADEPRIINDLRVPADDPCAEHLAGQRSLMALPVYDEGVALNMTFMLRAEPNAYGAAALDELVWTTNLFGRATQNLVLRKQVQGAFDALDKELSVVADVQRSLLPRELPDIRTMGLAAHYRTSARAGGDYYDFFPLPDGTWGVLIADVCGHGAPAAVLMAVTHAITHTHPGEQRPPSQLLSYVNKALAARYTSDTGTFVTAFYGVYDGKTREMTYSSAGHNPPRVKRCDDGSLFTLDGARSLPLGIAPDEEFTETTVRFTPGDQIIFYTDGVTEARGQSNELFGVRRLDEAISNCALDASGLVDGILEALERFRAGRAPDDDETIIVAKIR